MSDQITYNPGAVSDFASDVGSRAGQLHMIYEDTASKTNALQEFFAGHGAQGFFDARRCGWHGYDPRTSDRSPAMRPLGIWRRTRGPG